MSDLHAASVDFWQRHQVVDLPMNVTESQSLQATVDRVALYPGFAALMSWDHPHEGILDFGCGPGHDVVEFLLRGAYHVYAADCSAYALDQVAARMRAHGWEDRCTLLHDDAWPEEFPRVNHVNVAGVLQHLMDPVGMLRKFGEALLPGGDVWAMIYSSESDFYRQRAANGQWQGTADSGAPIAHAWSNPEFEGMAVAAGLDATYLGSYRGNGETTGPGLSSCWRLVPA